jgi:adenylate cyclase
VEPAYDDLGDQTLKNISEPVRAYVLRAVSVENLGDADAAFTVPGFSGRPAIAVLPFDNLSGDPDQEYFADGIAEDLITRLAAGRLFPVIARNSSFVYKGHAVDVKRVSRELGVRYVVEGSVRRAGDRVRITAQVIDATTGHHVWAERHDRELRDIFALQDEITDAILGSLQPALQRVEERRALQKAPASLDAWECCQRASWHLDKSEPEYESGVSWCRRALELDPQCTMALATLAYAHCIAATYQWTGSQGESIRLATESAERAVAFDADNPVALTALGMALFLRGEYERARAVISRALEVNPSHAPAHLVLGNILTVSGSPDEAIATAERGLRLSPNDTMTWGYWFAIALAHFSAGRYAEAVEFVRRSIYHRKNPGTYRLLAAACGHLGRIEEGQAALEDLFRLTPGFRVDGFRLYFPPSMVEPYFEGWRKLGWEG